MSLSTVEQIGTFLEEQIQKLERNSSIELKTESEKIMAKIDATFKILEYRMTSIDQKFEKLNGKVGRHDEAISELKLDRAKREGEQNSADKIKKPLAAIAVAFITMAGATLWQLITSRG